MQVILTEDVVGVGDIGETVSVRPGYARNFLIPRGFAIETEAANGRAIAHRMLQINAKKKKLKKDAEQRASALAAVTVELALRVGSGGKVFGSVGAKQISEKLQELGFDIDRRRVVLTEPIRRIGNRAVKIKLHAELLTEIQVNITPLAATSEEEEAETNQARRGIEAAAAERQAADDDLDDDSEE